MSQITRGQNRQYNAQFGICEKFILDATHAQPSGTVYNKIKVLVTTAAFSCTDSTVVSGSGSYPAIIPAGTELYGSFSDITVTAGTIICSNV